MTTKPDIEKKFLVDPSKLPADFAEYLHCNIRYVYLTRPEDSIQVRLRAQIHRNKALFLLATKIGSGIKRTKTECLINSEAFYKFYRDNQNISLVKERFMIEYQGVMIEVDIYDYMPDKPFSEMKITAKIELGSEDQLNDMNLPSWIKREVTNDIRYSNIRIAEFGFPTEEVET
ncbi:hypothetical protein KAJ41_00755 [Candidatus Parcubacteria bacterium]|nr:hypothetical protein [Candidatus Parcubacteria bacterium]